MWKLRDMKLGDRFRFVGSSIEYIVTKDDENGRPTEIEDEYGQVLRHIYDFGLGDYVDFIESESQF